MRAEPQVRQPQRTAAQGGGAGADAADEGGAVTEESKPDHHQQGRGSAEAHPLRSGRPRQATVIGPAGAELGSEAAVLGEEVGRLLAEAGVTLVCGGMGGTMAAACRGAREAGGEAI